MNHKSATAQLTPQDIDELLANRDLITVRYSYRTHQLDQIDRKLSRVEPGTDNRVDLALGRQCAELPARPDYNISAAQAEQVS